MAGWKKWGAMALTVLLAACMPPPGAMDRRSDGDWAAERSSTWRQEQESNGRWYWREKISYTTYYKGEPVSRQAYDLDTGKPIVSEWVRPPAGQEGDPRMNPVAYFQSRVQGDLARNEALWPTLGKAGSLQKDRCGDSANCRALDYRISGDKNRLDLMSYEFDRMAKWPPPAKSEIREASWPPTESRKPAVSLEGGTPAIPQPTITPQPGSYPGGGATPYHHP